jgi:hypothetical protein
MSTVHTVNKIHQILIVDGYALPERLPPLIQTNIDSATRMYSQAVHKVWGGMELRAFIRYHVGTDALWAFDYLRPYSYKCDLARFCLLYVEGGMYIDLGVQLMNSWHIPIEYGIGAFRDVRFISSSWAALQTGLLWSKPGRPELEQAIDWIIRNCRTHFYGENALYPTGPVLLGRSFIAAMAKKGNTEEADDQYVGECRCVTPEADVLNVSYVSREGTLIGLRTKTVSGDLTHLGLTGVNNYNQLWKSRKVYGEQESVWSFDDPSIKLEADAERSDTGIVVLSMTIGRDSYGPYVDLSEGTYRLTVFFAQQTSFSRIIIDVSAEGARKSIHVFDYTAGGSELHEALSFEFALDEPAIGVEFRLSIFGDFSGEIRSISLKQLSAYTWTFRHKRIECSGVSRTATGIAIPLGHAGRVVYGPYADIAAGAYFLKIAFSPETSFARLLVDICAGVGNNQLHVFRHKQRRRSIKAEITVPFEVDRPLTDVEFRLQVFGDFAGEFRSFTLFKTSDCEQDARPSATAKRRPPWRLLLPSPDLSTTGH